MLLALGISLPLLADDEVEEIIESAPVRAVQANPAPQTQSQTPAAAPAQATRRKGKGRSVNQAQGNTARESDATEDYFLEFRGSYAPAQSSSEVGSSEYKATLPAAKGHLRNYEFRYLKENTTLKILYRNQNTVFKNIPSMTPSSIDAAKQYANLSLLNKPFANSNSMFAKDLAFGAGLYFQTRRVERTEPKSVMTSSHSAGFHFGVEHELNFNQGFAAESHFEFELPTVFREYYDRTGYYSHGYNSEMGIAASFEMVPWQVWSLGVNARRTSVSFSGSGEQGVMNGSDTQWDFWIPLELRIRI